MVGNTDRTGCVKEETKQKKLEWLSSAKQTTVKEAYTPQRLYLTLTNNAKRGKKARVGNTEKLEREGTV